MSHHDPARGVVSPAPWRPRASIVLLLLGVVSLLPNLGAAWPGATYYFRDFSLTYYPLRALFASEMREGRWPFWNRYVYEGCPFLPMLYPGELLQLLWPGPAFVSWLLTLHFPIAAVAMYALARHLGTQRRGAFGAGAVYALGGLALSTLSLHWFLQALALAPLVALGLIRAGERGGRSIVLGGVLLALAVSTLAVEFVAQAVLFGAALALAARPRRDAVIRVAGAVALGVGLASAPIVLMLGIVGESLRGQALGPAQLLDRPLPPIALLQMAVAPDLFGSLTEPARFWWGRRVFTGGPYFMSLYLGPVVLAVAAAGFVPWPRRLRLALLAAGLLGLWYALGGEYGLAGLLAPILRFFRFPVKALLLPYLAIALAFGRGVDRLASGEVGRALPWAAAGLTLASGIVAAVGGSCPPALVTWLEVSPVVQAVLQPTLLREGLQALALSCLVLVLAMAVARGALRPERAAVLAVVCAIADLARAGVGVNPQVSPAFFTPMPAVQDALRTRGEGRVFSYGIGGSPARAAWAATRPAGVELWSFFLGRQLEDPFANLTDRIETAEGYDRLSFIPNPPALRPWEYDPALVDHILPRLRSAAVSHILSLDPLTSAGLHALGHVPTALEGLAIHVYAIREPLPRAFVSCRSMRAADRAEALNRPFSPDFDLARDVALEESVATACRAGTVERREIVGDRETYDVVLDGPGVLVMRESFAPSWRAVVDGQPTRVLRANGRYRAVLLPGGTHRVTLHHRPRWLREGVIGSLLSACAALGVWIRGRDVRGDG